MSRTSRMTAYFSVTDTMNTLNYSYSYVDFNLSALTKAIKIAIPEIGEMEQVERKLAIREFIKPLKDLFLVDEFFPSLGVLAKNLWK